MAKLCPRGKAAAKRKFKVYPSAYANMYASKVCKGKVSPTITSVKPSKNIKKFEKHKQDVAKSTEKFTKGLTEEGKIKVRKGTGPVLGKISNILKRGQ